MKENFLRTGQAAKQLGVSTYKVRQLCESGLIPDAELTEANQWLVPTAAVERLNQDGLPTAPTAPKATAPRAKANGNGASQPKRVALIAPPSETAVNAAEDSFIEERNLEADTHKLARMRVRKEGLELQDWFESRDQARIDRELEQDRRESELAERRRQERIAESAAEERRRFEARWWAYALRDARPWDAPDDYAAVVRSEIMSALADMPTDMDDDTMRGIVKGAIAAAMRPCREEKARNDARRQAVQGALRSLPLLMQYEDAWKAKAEKAARDAIDGARDGTAAAAAKLAVLPLVAEYEHQQRLSQAQSLVFTNGTPDEDEEARDAVRVALAGLPVGASDREIEKAKQAAMAPIRERIATRIAHQRAAEERKEAKRRLLQVGLQEVYPHAERMLREFEFDPGETALGIMLRTKPEVQRRLESELVGSESEGDVKDRVHELMEEAEGCE